MTLGVGVPAFFGATAQLLQIVPATETQRTFWHLEAVEVHALNAHPLLQTAVPRAALKH